MPEVSSDWLTHQWILAGIVSASSRFIPIPFVDDLVRDQCRRFVVSRTLATEGSQTGVSLETLKPYYSSGGGCLGGCLATVAKAPLKLLLFPIRKIVSVVTSVRGVPLEIMRMVLLGRTLRRYITNDEIAIDPAYAAQMRMSFEESFARMDFRVARAAMSDALASVSGWKTDAMESAKRIASKNNTHSDTLETSDDIESGAAKVQEVLDRPEIVKLFAEFDRRFDERMQASLFDQSS
ncbi:hypothetical protein [Aporhodopirellula aestuarii]|uniref:Uncharacterized protein n=1 Tax=Aporhodopirellula aestuarii TaxID=2950107 RepID=A0ABT0U9X4_9BACT|nr:hypothetical protein [Aporhodopirellula aestuarii]MCM2373670.1 hypothetical protein [Aporhodopirellula aestuarii]